MASISDEIKEALYDLSQAVQRLHSARDRLALARREENEAINEVNKAQKSVDDAVAGFKVNPPRETNWARAKAHKEA